MTDNDRARFGAVLSATMQTYLQAMTADMAAVWWGALGRYEFADISAALSDHIRDPYAGKWAPKPAEIIGRLRPRPEATVKRIDYKRHAPDARIFDRIKNLAKTRESSGPYWTPERVVNQQQVNYIVLQARHFGPMSMQGRFLADCVAAGAITSDHRLGTPNMREPGEDEEEPEGESLV